MKTITKMELQPGMTIGEDVIAFGKVLYPSGTKVDQNLIDRLNRHPIMCVTVMEDIDFATTHYERVRLNENFKAFEQAYLSRLNYYKTLINSFLVTGRKPDDKALLGIYNELYSYITTGPALLDYLYNMVPNEDELTFRQCLNSALLAGTFADWLSMNEEDKNILILCGFYYDIGKLKLPYDLLWKPDKLTDEEFATVKNHTVIGYSMVRNLELNEHVKNAVIMHHERLDGSGYPYRMTGSKIDVFARYIAIVDAYIAMASPRAYRNAFTPLQILGKLENSLAQFDVELLMPLMNRIADAQIGSMVQLNDDTIWEVLIIHQNNFSRPFLKNENGDILDLAEYPELEIVKNV